ncbi:MAG: STAS domain-containing protein [Planctomycetota bacterium]
MKTEHIQHGTVLVVVPDGALIEEESEGFASSVRRCFQGGNVKIILQMNNVPFIDSAGLETLVALYGEALGLGGEVKISSPTDIGRDILKATRIDSLIEVYDATPDARRSFVETGV